MTGGDGRAGHGTGRWAVALGLLAALSACAAPLEGRAAAVDAVAAPTAPGEPAPGITPPPAEGISVEAARLAAATPYVREVLPDRADTCGPAGPLTSPGRVEDLGAYPPGTVEPVLVKYGYVAGWRACAAPPDAPPEVRSVADTLEMADPAAARATAAELAATSLRSGEQQTSVLGGSRAQVLSEGDREVVEIWVPVGRTIGFVRHNGPAGTALGEATRLADAHARLLAAFTPTPQAEVADLPVDPLGLVPRMVRPPGDVLSGTGWYGLAATLHTAADPVATRALLTTHDHLGGFRIRTDDGILGYLVVLDAFPGPAQAEAVRAAYAAVEDGYPDQRRIALPAVPDATCHTVDRGTTGAPLVTQRCLVTRGGYLAPVDVYGSDRVDDTTTLGAMVRTQVDLIDG
ncbi:DUF7373 family lipoprotein [Pseudonocardia humida]|uniref:DUF7373 domain-containing protein n=1 Tax=Pseudonocardia humida TaxID=2800819 RepID=A0ABT1A4S7_9PSEU|nr:hypothetical protein [Pseudonocardia humida]MCO1657936.1 hypothetical protein [Pseudonocardia humida]